MFDFDGYIRVYNLGDDGALVGQFFADDVEYTTDWHSCKGKEEFRHFLTWLHSGVREVIRVQSMCRTENRFFAEIDADFHGSKVRDDFPFGMLRPGDVLTVKFLITYDVNDMGKVSRLKAMAWPAGRGVTTMPRLGGSLTQMAAYGSYAAAFSAGEHDRYSAFYTDDVTLDLGLIPRIEGRTGVVDFYTSMFEQVREGLTIHKFLADDEAIFVDATSTFTAIRDAPDFLVGAISQGEYITLRLFVFYTLRDGLMSSIKVVLASKPDKFAADGSLVG